MRITDDRSRQQSWLPASSRNHAFRQKDHIRTLAQGSTQCRDIILGINIDLTLAYDTPVVPVKEFQRILQCDDVLVIVFIDMVDDAREVVDFPLPAGPVTSTIPLEKSAKRMIFSGIPNVAGSGKVKEIIRITTDREPLCLNALTRNRERPGTAKEKSSSPVSSSMPMSRCPASS